MQQSEQPLVSVIVCVYNAGAYLRPSLLSALEQTYRNLEILMVDDGSTDGCMETISDLLKDSRIRVFRQENKGQPAALNVAMENVRGEYIAIHDADDLSEPHRIETQVKVMQANPDLAAVFSGNDLICNDRRMAPFAIAKDRARCKRDVEAFRMPAHDPTAIYRTSLVGDMRFDESLPVVQSVDFVLRVGEKFPTLVLGECLYSYRIHYTSVTRQDPHKRARLIMEALRLACNRRGLDFGRMFPQSGDDLEHKKSNHFKDNYIATNFLESVWYLRSTGRRIQALITGIHCALLHPLDPSYHKPWVLALSPMPVLDGVHARYHSAGQSA